MKHRGMTELQLARLFVILMMMVAGIVGIITLWQDSDTGLRVTVIVIICAVIAGVTVILYHLLHPAVYAESRADGIHVFSRKAGQLAFIDWKDVKDYRVVLRALDAPKIYYDLLILQRDAMFGDKPISMFRKYRYADEQRISEHRLDELMGKLYAGTMTAEEFRNQPFIFMISEQTPVFKKMWRKRRKEFRLKEDGAEDVPQ